MSILSLQQADIFRVLQGRNIKWVIAAINLLLVIWIASLLASLTWDLVAPSDESLVEALSSDARALAADPYAESIRRLPGWHLLGTLKKQTPVVADTPVNAPETRLKLVLHGVFASALPGNARAIIADPKGEEEQYAIGDELPGNVELSEIYPDRVILKRNGRYETLRLLQDQPLDVDWTMPTRNRNPVVGRVRDIPKSFKQNPRTFMQVIRPRPFLGDDRKMIGYTLLPGQNRQLFEELGLREGDVAIEINDVRLDSASNGMQVLRGIKGGDTATLTVLRDGEEQVLYFQMPM